MATAANRPCPKCRSMGRDKTGDHLFLLESGDAWYCNRCKYVEKTSECDSEGELEDFDITSTITTEEIRALPSPSPYRDIDPKFLEAAGVKTGMSSTNRSEVAEVFYPIFSVDGNLVAYKRRRLPKDFSVVGGSIKGIPVMFFGQMEVGTGSKLLIVVEGEDDVLMARDVLASLGKSYNVVGLQSAAYAERTARDNIHFLESFETVVFLTDQDKPGHQAAVTMSNLLSSGKAKIGKFSEKDICDMAAAGKHKDILQAIWTAKTYTPEGIIAAGDYKDKYLSQPPRVSLPLDPCYATLDEMIDGVGRGELTLVTGGTGSGKSQMFDQCTAHWLQSGYRVGKLAMEHNVARSIDNTLSVLLQKNLKRHRDEIGVEAIDAAYDKYLADNRYFLIDHSYDDATDATLIDKVRQLAVTSQCDVIVVDHLSAILYEDSSGDSGISREDRVVRELVKIANRFHVAIVLVAHPRKSTSGTKSVESGAFLTLDDLKGSSGIKQQPDVIISAVRDSQNEDALIKTVTEYHVLKNRYHSDTGPAGKTTFNVDTANYEVYQDDQGEF